MGRNTEVCCSTNRARKATHRLPYGASSCWPTATKVKRGTKLADWDPYTVPIITEKTVMPFTRSCRGMSIREELDEATGISSRVLTGLEQQP